MSNMAWYRTDKTPNPITEYRESVNTPDFKDLPNVLIDPNISGVSGQPIRYWKHVTGAIQLMTQGERDAVDAEIASNSVLQIRSGSKNLIDVSGPDGIILRAFADIIKDELNILRQWLASYKTEMAMAISLADLKTRVAGLPATPDRTLSQLKTAIKNRIDSGLIDS